MQAVASAIGTAPVMTRVALTTSSTLAGTALPVPAKWRARRERVAKRARPALSAAGTLPTKLTGNANLPQVYILI